MKNWMLKVAVVVGFAGTVGVVAGSFPAAVVAAVVVLVGCGLND